MLRASRDDRPDTLAAAARPNELRPGTRPLLPTSLPAGRVSRSRATPMMSRSARIERQRSLMLCRDRPVASSRGASSPLLARPSPFGSEMVLRHRRPRRIVKPARAERDRGPQGKSRASAQVQGASGSPGTHDGDGEERRCSSNEPARSRPTGGSRAGSRSYRARCRTRLPAPAGRPGCGHSDRLRLRPAGRESQPEGRDQVRRYTSDARRSDARQTRRTAFLHQLAELVHQRKDRLRAAIHDRATADLHHLHPGQELDGTPARNGAGQVGIEQGLAGERRSDVLGRVGRFGHRRRLDFALMMVPTCSPASARVRLPGTRPFTTCTS